MLLESALADFSTDESGVFEDAQAGQGLEWESTPGKPNPPSIQGEGSKTRAGPADIKHVSVDLTPTFTRQSAGDLSKAHSRTSSGPSESFHNRQSSGSQGASRSPPSFENAAVDEVPFHAIGREAHAARSADHCRLSAAETIPFAWEGSPRTPKALKDTSVHKAKLVHVAPDVLISMLKNEEGFSPSPKKNHRKQQSRSSSLIKLKDVLRSHESPRLASLGDEEMNRTHLFNSTSGRRLENHLCRTDADIYVNSEKSDYRYNEESPVSTLQHPASPPTTNSSGASGPVNSPQLPGSAASTLPGAVLVHRRMPSVSAPSAHSSPALSTSSSKRYMGHCLERLQRALATDPERSKRFEDSFVQMDIVDGDEPEYDAMDFYADSEEELYHERFERTSSGASSLARSSSGSSISRRIRRSVKNHPISVDEYSQKDRRYLLDHPSSWVERGEDSIGSSFANSKRNTLNRHQEVSWDEQQADLDFVRADEVVRGAIEGLRFTYSPVSTAFVFTRSNKGDEQATSGRKRHSHHRTITDSEASMRSISLDYETSVCSEDSLSFARGSDVTELRLSRAESWSKVARGNIAALQHGYQDAVPTSFIVRGGHAPIFEDANDGTSSNESPAFNPRRLDNCTDLVRKRPVKKSGMATCFSFKSILRSFWTIEGPGPSRLRLTRSDDNGHLQ